MTLHKNDLFEQVSEINRQIAQLSSNLAEIFEELSYSIILGSANRLLYSRYVRLETEIHKMILEVLQHASDDISEIFSKVIEIPLEKIGVKRLDGDLYEVRIGKLNIVDLDTGVSYLLLLLILTLIASRIFIAEISELHLHPKAQANFMNLILNYLIKEDIQAIIETHSEHILSRVCRFIAEGELSSKDVKIYYVFMSDEGTKIKEIKIDEIDRLFELPDFYEFDILELISTFKARSLIKLADLEELIKIYKSRIEAGDTYLADIVEILELLLKIGKAINSGNFEDVKNYVLSKLSELEEILNYVERLL